MIAHTGAGVDVGQRESPEVVKLSSMYPRSLSTDSLSATWVVNGFVLVPIQTVISLSVPTDSRNARFKTTGAENSSRM